MNNEDELQWMSSTEKGLQRFVCAEAMPAVDKDFRIPGERHGFSGQILWPLRANESYKFRPTTFKTQSLLYEACGRIVNPIYGCVGLLWSGNWQICQAAVESVLRGCPVRPLPLAGSDDTKLPTHQLHNVKAKVRFKRPFHNKTICTTDHPHHLPEAGLLSLSQVCNLRWRRCYPKEFQPLQAIESNRFPVSRESSSGSEDCGVGLHWNTGNDQTVNNQIMENAEDCCCDDQKSAEIRKEADQKICINEAAVDYLFEEKNETKFAAAAENEDDGERNVELDLRLGSPISLQPYNRWPTSSCSCMQVPSPRITSDLVLALKPSAL